MIHPKVQELLTKHGKTLEQVKKEHTGEYQAVLEAIASDSLAQTARITELTGQVTTLETNLQAATVRAVTAEQGLVKESRAKLVDDAIAAANLPVLPPTRTATPRWT
ncbi:hypothetical protein [Deinococcus multiflagellatus]|uniref:Uncharacterized protein n=1 Tax=Deinococcus multiflagellatus TaxID=1656887 RepID=A0ABW1ZTR6_9DEIO